MWVSFTCSSNILLNVASGHKLFGAKHDWDLLDYEHYFCSQMLINLKIMKLISLKSPPFEISYSEYNKGQNEQLPVFGENGENFSI